MGHEPSCPPRKKARREASGEASKASERSLERSSPAKARRERARKPEKGYAPSTHFARSAKCVDKAHFVRSADAGSSWGEFIPPHPPRTLRVRMFCIRKNYPRVPCARCISID